MSSRKDKEMRKETINGMVWEINTYFVPEKGWFCYEIIGTRRSGSGFKNRSAAYEAAIKALE
jgi:hypothetical protein